MLCLLDSLDEMPACLYWLSYSYTRLVDMYVCFFRISWAHAKRNRSGGRFHEQTTYAKRNLSWFLGIFLYVASAFSDDLITYFIIFSSWWTSWLFYNILYVHPDPWGRWTPTKVSRPKLVTLVDAVAERGEARQPYGGKIGRLIRTGGLYYGDVTVVN